MTSGDDRPRLRTGVDGLDRGERLGGVPAGSTIGVVSPPLSMAYLLGYPLFESGRQTIYVSTTRRAQDVRRDVERTVDRPVADGSRVADVRNDLGVLPDPILDHLDDLEEGGNFVLDTATAMHDVDGYRETIRAIQEATYDRNGVSYVYFATPDVGDLTRRECEILHALDGAFVVSHDPTDRDVETYLHLHKLRDVDPGENAFKLDFDRRVTVDPSQNIS